MKEHKTTGAVDAIVVRGARVVMWLTAIIVVVISYEVIMRYIFKRPTLWAYELSWWIAGIIYLLAGIYVMQQRAHIRITLFYDKMPLWMRRASDILIVSLLLLFCFAVIWGGYNEALAKMMRWERIGSAWDPPIPATLKPLIMVTVVVLGVQAVLNLIHDWNADHDSTGNSVAAKDSNKYSTNSNTPPDL